MSNENSPPEIEGKVIQLAAIAEGEHTHATLFALTEFGEIYQYVPKYYQAGWTKLSLSTLPKDP